MALTPLAEMNLKIEVLEAVVTAMIYRRAEQDGSADKAEAFVKDLEGESFEVLNDGTPRDPEREKRLIALHEGFFKGVRNAL